MRCKNCNVDLGENYELCPLCGQIASDDEALIPNIVTSSYPDYNSPTRKSQHLSDKKYLCYPKIVFAITSALVAFFLILSIVFSNAKIMDFGATFFLSASGFAYFFFMTLSKKFESEVVSYSVANALLSALMMIIGIISHVSFLLMLITFSLNIIVILIALLIKPSVIYPKLKAIFVL